MRRLIEYARILLGYTPDTVQEWESEEYRRDVKAVWTTTLLAAISVIVMVLSWRYAMDLEMFGDIKQLQEQRKIDREFLDKLADVISEENPNAWTE